MVLNKKMYMILIEVYILALQVQGRCVGFSQNNNTEFCEATERFDKEARNITNVFKNDVKTTTLSQIFPKTIANSSTDDLDNCPSELNLENKLINIAIDNLLDLRSLNLIKLSQDKANFSYNKKNDNITAFTVRAEAIDLDKIIRKRSAVEFKTLLPHKQNSKKNKKLRHQHPQPKHRFYKY